MMRKILLKSESSNETIILKYLEKNASESLVEKINNGKKTLAQCWNYIKNEARKLAVAGCACVEDQTVFGWAIHFFEEDSIKGENFAKTASQAAVKTAPKVEKKNKKPAPKIDEDQISFNLFL